MGRWMSHLVLGPEWLWLASRLPNISETKKDKMYCCSLITFSDSLKLVQRLVHLTEMCALFPSLQTLKPLFCVTVHHHLIYLFSVTSSLYGVLFKCTFICLVLEKCILSAGVCPAGPNPLCRGLPANFGHWHGYHAGKNHYHKEGINHISTGTKQCSTVNKTF